MICTGSPDPLYGDPRDPHIVVVYRIIQFYVRTPCELSPSIIRIINVELIN